RQYQLDERVGVEITDQKDFVRVARADSKRTRNGIAWAICSGECKWNDILNHEVSLVVNKQTSAQVDGISVFTFLAVFRTFRRSIRRIGNHCARELIQDHTRIRN